VSRPWLLLALALAACDRPHDIAVRVSIPGPDSVAAPAAGVGLIALPYDRDSVLRALAAAAPTRRPSTAELDTLFQRFRVPFSEYATASLEAEKLRGALASVKARLDSLPRNAAEYRTLYAHFGQRSSELARAEQREQVARKALDTARATFIARSDTLRARVRLWEDSTYRAYDSIVSGLARARGLTPVTDTTGRDGWAHFKLQRGPWWIYARSWDATDPNAEWYWNVKVAGDTVLLTDHTGLRRPKY
jgi:hypothetical protein